MIKTTSQLWRRWAFRILVPCLICVVLFLVLIFGVVVPTFEYTIMERQRQELHSLVDVAWSVLATYYDLAEQGATAPEAAQARALAVINRMRYGPEARDYYWVLRLDGEMLAHPYRPDLQGQMLLDYADPQGRQLFAEMIQVVSQQDAGYVEYEWQLLDEVDTSALKVSYVRLFEPWGWIVGTGFYVESVSSQIGSLTRALLLLCALILLPVAGLLFLVVRRTLETEGERTRIAAELGRERDLVARILETSPSAVIMVNLEGRMVFANARAETLLGLSRAQLAQRAVSDARWQITSFDGAPCGEEDLAVLKAMRTAQPIWDVRHMLTTAHGRRLRISINAAPLFDEQGRVDGAVTTFDDLTQELATQEAMREANQRLALHVQHMPLAYVEFDPAFRITRWNPAAERLFGYTQDEAVGRSVFDLVIPEEARPQVVNVLQSLVDGKSGTPNINENVTKDGRRIICEWYNTPLFDEEGAVIGMASTAQDITVRRQDEEERARLLARVQEQARQMQRIMDAVPEGVLLISEAGQVLLANPLGQKDLRLLADAEVGETITHLGGHSLTHLLDIHQETAWHQASVHERVFEFMACLAFSSSDARAWVVVIRDMTRDREMQQRLRHQERLAVIGQLAGGVAHDFNNILTAIKGYTAFVLQGLPPDDPLRQDMGEIDRAANRAASLVHQLLAFSRKQMLRPEPLDLSKVVSDMAGLLYRLMGEDVRLELDLASPLGLISADPGQMEQVVMNLALNARDAMPQGGDLLIRAQDAYLAVDDTRYDPPAAPGAYVRLTIEDTGVGMSDEVLSHIFEPFFTTKEQGKGTGLGLSMVYGVVNQSDGHIVVTSVSGQGTCFEILLPHATVGEER